MLAGHLKEKLNFDVDDLCKLPADDLRWQVDYAISQVCKIWKTKCAMLKMSTRLRIKVFSNQRHIYIMFKIVKRINPISSFYHLYIFVQIFKATTN